MKNKEIKKAFQHVKQFFPDVSIVVFDKNGRWCYMNEYFDAFNFESQDIDQSILEDASDSLDTLPFVYQP